MKEQQKKKRYKEELKLREWEYQKRYYYHGFFKCSSCNKMTYCTGKTRNRVKCKPCFTGITEPVEESS